jgi:hypothetical protein
MFIPREQYLEMQLENLLRVLAFLSGTLEDVGHSDQRRRNGALSF